MELIPKADKRKKNTSLYQYNQYLTFLEEDEIFRTGFIPPGCDTNYLVLKWKELAEKLNEDDKGPKLSAEEWRKRLTDWKHTTRAKERKINEGNNHLCLTPMELRFVELWGCAPTIVNITNIKSENVPEIKIEKSNEHEKADLFEEVLDSSEPKGDLENITQQDLQLLATTSQPQLTITTTTPSNEIKVVEQIQIPLTDKNLQNSSQKLVDQHQQQQQHNQNQQHNPHQQHNPQHLQQQQQQQQQQQTQITQITQQRQHQQQQHHQQQPALQPQITVTPANIVEKKHENINLIAPPPLKRVRPNVSQQTTITSIPLTIANTNSFIDSTPNNLSANVTMSVPNTTAIPVQISTSRENLQVLTQSLTGTGASQHTNTLPTTQEIAYTINTLQSEGDPIPVIDVQSIASQIKRLADIKEQKLRFEIEKFKFKNPGFRYDF